MIPVYTLMTTDMDESVAFTDMEDARGPEAERRREDKYVGGILLLGPVRLD